MSLVASKSYVCDLQKILGRGSFGNVHLGFRILNGEPVAIKLFKKSVPQHNLAQEFEIMKCIHHDNIVRLISIEHHAQLGQFIVMELCSEGSLLNVLEHPKNLYGLEEDEFLLLLSNVAEGMKYLRDKNFIHRDIKPGNILRSLKPNGEYIYKLTDFGAARILEEGEYFTSIYGTEEYLHPDIYGYAVCHASKNRNFNSTVDLWSIGVTLYQAATGNIPFKAFDGRRDKSTMYRIISTKPSGVISGTQIQPNGPILWDNELPCHCSLSTKLKSIVTPLLIGLLERRPELSWNFDKFFNEVNHIVSLKRITIFYVNEMRLITTYLKPNDVYAALQVAITEQAAVAEYNQMLFGSHNLLSEKEKDMCVRDYPDYNKKAPLILIDSENNNHSETIPHFLNIVQSNENNDLKQLMANEYVNERKIEDMLYMNNQCKTAKQLMYTTIVQQRQNVEVNINYLIRSCLRFKQNICTVGRNELNLEIHQELEILENLKSNGITSMNKLSSYMELLQDENDTNKDAEDSIKSIQTLKTKIRTHRDAIFNSTNSTERKKFYVLYIMEMSKELTDMYSRSEMYFKKVQSCMINWHDSIKTILSEMKILKEHLQKWNHCNEKLENMMNYATKEEDIIRSREKIISGDERATLNRSLRKLQKGLSDSSDLLKQQSSLIGVINLIINDCKIEDTFEDETY